MIGHFIKAVGQLSDPRTRWVLIKSILATLVLLIALLFVAGYVVGQLEVTDYEWLEWFIDTVGVLAVFFVAMLLFPAAVTVIVGFFLEEVADACEARHYPGLPPPRSPPLSETLIGSLRFAALAIALNLVLAPLYLILLFAPPLNVFVFYAVNGYLLGREYFELVALRRLEPGSVHALRRSRRGRVFVIGAGIAFLLTIPIVNLLTPLLATAFMVHTVEAMRAGVKQGAGA